VADVTWGIGADGMSNGIYDVSLPLRLGDFMSRVEKIENQIKELSQDELTALREWFAAFDGDAWDRQMEADISAGKLDNLAERALRDHEAGRSTKL